MAYLNPNVFDNGLSYAQTNGTRMEICNGEPANYAGIAAVALGNKTVVTGAPAAGAVDGRRVIVPAITDGDVTAGGTPTHWALHNGSSILVATGELDDTQAVISGNKFSLDAVNISLRAAVEV